MLSLQAFADLMVFLITVKGHLRVKVNIFKGLEHDRKDIEAVPNMKDCLQLSHTITTTWEFSVSV